MTNSASFLQISFRPDLHLLIMRWLRDVTQAELKQGYSEVLQAAQQHNATCWLVDSRRRVQSDEAMVQWLANDYLPTLSAQLGNQLIRLACLVAATWQPAEAPATPLAVLAQRPSQAAYSYHVQLFGDEGTAMQWLQASC
ncbi:hypothetical protein [Hymenobacter perfusus]|uniref:STAS/SEC14 domain-containing protein n=1 Tax=Hymenobacter perfusus TaxID=1236770 RepID=A0A3R9NZK9_9BACT|nr:hypothetical protein [Hymenobacter perfusus]RSK41065.1 hypothetical protein EI293_16675 [Hymenobacter perfusus]